MNATATAIYDQVLRGLAEEWKHIDTLDRGFTQLLHEVRHVERLAYQGSPPASWDDKWERAESLLENIHSQVTETRQLLERGDPVTEPAAPLAEWEATLRLEKELAQMLSELKEMSAPQVAKAHRLEWDACWAELESYFATIQAHAKAVQVKLELRKRFGETRASEMTAQVLSHLPEDLRSEEGLRAYREAIAELQEEKQHFTGFFDVVKSLLLYFEGPEERAQRKRSS